MLLTHFIWQTVLKPLSGMNAKNGAITPSLTPTMQARCYNAGKWVRATWRGITNSSKHLGADDRPFIVLTETKFSFRCIPVWIGTLLTGLGSKKKHM